jgi:hypothetical protein
LFFSWILTPGSWICTLCAMRYALCALTWPKVLSLGDYNEKEILVHVCFDLSFDGVLNESNH